MPFDARVFSEDISDLINVCFLRFDRDSAIGKFTWRTIGEEEDKFVPAIYRNDEEFVSVRMVEIFGLNDFLNVLPMELFESIKLTAYYVSFELIDFYNIY